MQQNHQLIKSIKRQKSLAELKKQYKIVKASEEYYDDEKKST